MLKAPIIALFLALTTLSVGLLVWQTDFAETEAASRLVPPLPELDHDGVPQTLTDTSPLTARVIAGIQSLFRAPQDNTPAKPTVNRGGFEQRDGFDIRYTKRPGD